MLGCMCIVFCVGTRYVVMLYTATNGAYIVRPMPGRCPVLADVCIISVPHRFKPIGHRWVTFQCVNRHRPDIGPCPVPKISPLRLHTPADYRSILDRISDDT